MYEPPPPPHEIDWDIHAAGRAWGREEAVPRYELAAGKMEMIDGKLLWAEDDRLRLLGLLLENVGADAAVSLGDPAVWRAAVNRLPAPGDAPA